MDERDTKTQQALQSIADAVSDADDTILRCGVKVVNYDDTIAALRKLGEK